MNYCELSFTDNYCPIKGPKWIIFRFRELRGRALAERNLAVLSGERRAAIYLRNAGWIKGAIKALQDSPDILLKERNLTIQGGFSETQRVHLRERDLGRLSGLQILRILARILNFNQS